MKILVGIGHPGHVHFYKNFIWEMEKKGHEIDIITRDRDMAIDLLDRYGFDYHKKKISPKNENIPDPISYMNYPRFEYETYNFVKELDPDIWTGIGGTTMSHVSTILDIKSILFTDTENARLSNSISFPFADVICTPTCYKHNIGPKQISYPGYHELAYLHPNRFNPDPSVLDYTNASKDDKIVILRLVAWDAMHDVGDSGFSDVVDVVRRLESTGAEVVITAEGDIPEEVEYCQSKIPPHMMHDLMYYSDLFIGESATMASESAMLGTPGIFVSSSRRGYTDELEDKYGFVFNFSGKNRQEKGLEKAMDILTSYDKKKWKRIHENILKDKIDVTKFMVWLFENYPESIKKENKRKVIEEFS